MTDQVVTAVKKVYLRDYQAPEYTVEQLELDVDLYEDHTVVTAILKLHACQAEQIPPPLVLCGEALVLKSIMLQDQLLTSIDYQRDDKQLVIQQPPAGTFELQIVTEIKPQDNTALTGLYRSGDLFCTQCEAEGFRRITYYLDRPDVMTCFTTTIHADKHRYPVLLANGNLVSSGLEGAARHYARWRDPFKKPCYLFAMVAGALLAVEDHYITVSGRLVRLKLYVERENIAKTGHAVQALKKAMAWDERVYGREYDLDIYMVVAVNDFTMGAMENKGLNIFNSKYVLASDITATDEEFAAIDAVIGHEYFHNWSGNRVTCRDWFQLSLKEGLTVFREQQFAEEISASPVSRIQQVKLLRTRQFAEDAGPTAHAVRPQNYAEINNFYTLTVYEKGAEIVRMLLTLLGRQRFRQAMDYYFATFDGQAVTIEDFLQAMAITSGLDLSQFQLWYSQAGTPVVKVTEHYDVKRQLYTLTFQQSCAPTPGQAEKAPLHIPIAMALFDSWGQAMPLQLAAEDLPQGTERVLALTAAQQSFTFQHITEKPVASLLRDFSAPVRLNYPRSEQALVFLLRHDSDDLNRWDAGQQWFEGILLQRIHTRQNEPSQQLLPLPEILCPTLQQVLCDDTLNMALKAELCSLPSLLQLIELMPVADPEAIYQAREEMLRYLATTLQQVWLAAFEAIELPTHYRYHVDDVAKRRLKAVILSYLLYSDLPEKYDLAVTYYQQAKNMTDQMAALRALNDSEAPQRHAVLEDFYQHWSQDPLVVNKWLALQAQSSLPTTFATVQALLQHRAFDIKNPNKVYALVGGFCANNPLRFHDSSGCGYTFLRDMVLQLDVLNPQVAARMITPLLHWKKFDVQRQGKMQTQLQYIRQQPNLSTDVLALVDSALTA